MVELVSSLGGDCIAPGLSFASFVLSVPITVVTFGRSHRLGLPMMVCVECLPADKLWDVVSVTRRSSGVAPRACVRVYARVLVPPNLYIHTHTYIIHTLQRPYGGLCGMPACG